MGTAAFRHRGIRPRVERAFLHWFREHRSRFAIAPRIAARTDTMIALSFEGITPMIVAYIGRDGAGVDVERGRVWFDRLLDLDVAPRRGQS